MVLPPRGLSKTDMGSVQAVQPLFVETSSHSLLECRQHAVCPNVRVCPASCRDGFSGRCSRERHCYRFVVSFPSFGHHASISLHPFAPPELPGFLATMDALTPERPALRILMRDNEHLPVAVQVSLLYISNLLAAPSPTILMPSPNPSLVSFGAYRTVCRPYPSRDLGVTWASP